MNDTHAKGKHLPRRSVHDHGDLCSQAFRSPFQANRSIKQQENRLQAALQHRNEALSSIGELRSRIEGLRRERLACTEILQKAEATLKSDQRKIIGLLTESASAAEQREAVSQAPRSMLTVQGLSLPIVPQIP